ncbi:hypothetical protein RND81_13G129100 [Saponaria officinalis]|uniref:TF-B3 domain-containing protein n=1 Tax=Saponaria officinalis TaxID=3572 RepID=A0AAW1H034_SAPOF
MNVVLLIYDYNCEIKLFNYDLSVVKRIPPPFIKNFSGNIPHTITLTDSIGRDWPANLGFRENVLHITEGWQQYVEDHHLKRGDFVVLRYLQNSTFLVLVYGPNGCAKEPPLPAEPVVVVGPNAAVGQIERKIRFQKIFTSNFKNFVTLPKLVVQACTFTVDQDVMVRNDEGVSVMTQLRGTADRFVLGYTNLTRFWHMIGVEMGDKLEFEVVCDGESKIKEVIVNILSESPKFGRGY